MVEVRPNILWAQRRDKVTISIYLTDIRDEKCVVEGGKFCFSGVGGDGKKYRCEFDFYGEIDPEKSKQRKTAREMFFSLAKKEEGPYWPRLVKEKVSYIKVDFNRWKDEDESDEDEDQFQDGLENLMHNMDMGGGGANSKFDPGDVPDSSSDDSDDEPIPELS